MKKEEWLKRYKARLIERGLTESEAQDLTDNESEFFEFGIDGTPEESVDEELSL